MANHPRILKIVVIQHNVDSKKLSYNLLQASRYFSLPNGILCSFDVFPNAFLALEYSQHSYCDLIICHRDMPQIYSSHVLHILRNVGAITPIIELIGEESTRTEQDSKKEGFFDILKLKYSSYDLQRIILRYLEMEKNLSLFNLSFMSKAITDVLKLQQVNMTSNSNNSNSSNNSGHTATVAMEKQNYFNGNPTIISTPHILNNSKNASTIPMDSSHTIYQNTMPYTTTTTTIQPIYENSGPYYGIHNLPTSSFDSNQAMSNSQLLHIPTIRSLVHSVQSHLSNPNPNNTIINNSINNNNNNNATIQNQFYPMSLINPMSNHNNSMSMNMSSVVDFHGIPMPIPIPIQSNSYSSNSYSNTNYSMYSNQSIALQNHHVVNEKINSVPTHIAHHHHHHHPQSSSIPIPMETKSFQSLQHSPKSSNENVITTANAIATTTTTTVKGKSKKEKMNLEEQKLIDYHSMKFGMKVRLMKPDEPIYPIHTVSMNVKEITNPKELVVKPTQTMNSFVTKEESTSNECLNENGNQKQISKEDVNESMLEDLVESEVHRVDMIPIVPCDENTDSTISVRCSTSTSNSISGQSIPPIQSNFSQSTYSSVPKTVTTKTKRGREVSKEKKGADMSKNKSSNHLMKSKKESNLDYRADYVMSPIDNNTATTSSSYENNSNSSRHHNLDMDEPFDIYHGDMPILPNIYSYNNSSSSSQNNITNNINNMNSNSGKRLRTSPFGMNLLSNIYPEHGFISYDGDYALPFENYLIDDNDSDNNPDYHRLVAN